MRLARTIGLSCLLWALACQAPVHTLPSGGVNGLLGCWTLSLPVLRGTPRDSVTTAPFSMIELLEVSLGQYGPVRVLGAPGLRATEYDANFRLHGWRPVPPDSVEIIWSMRPNAAEVRLRVHGDSAHGEYFYHGDILLPGQGVDDLRRPPRAVRAARVRCPLAPAG